MSLKFPPNHMESMKMFVKNWVRKLRTNWDNPGKKFSLGIVYVDRLELDDCGVWVA